MFYKTVKSELLKQFEAALRKVTFNWRKIALGILAGTAVGAWALVPGRQPAGAGNGCGHERRASGVLTVEISMITEKTVGRC